MSLLVARRGSLRRRASGEGGGGGSYADVVAADSPFAWWRFEETSGSTTADEQGNHDGAVTGADLTATGASGTGSAASFDGVDDNIDVGTLGTFGSQMNGGITLEVWLKWTATGAAVVGGTVNDADSTILSLWVNRDDDGSTRNGGVNLQIREAASSGRQVGRSSSRADLNDGGWHHIAFTWNGGSGAPDVWVDGVIDNGSSRTGAGTTSDFEFPLTWGARNLRGTLDNFANVDLDEPAVYQTVLSETRIVARYDAGVA